MGSVSGKQVFVIVGALVLSVVLYFLPTKKEQKGDIAEKITVNNAQLEISRELETAKQRLNAESKDELKRIEQSLSERKDTVGVYEALGKKWDALREPLIAAYYFEEIALRSPSEKNWLNAAFRYFDAFKASKDEVRRGELVKKAIAGYSKVVALNPKNLDAKTDLGVCYTETPQPMEGIKLLREVVAEKPEHENAQLNLGFLSVKSRQFDKAIERFETVSRINPNNANVHLYLGETYLQKGDKKKAIGSFEKYKKVSKDSETVDEVNRYIENIKNN